MNGGGAGGLGLQQSHGVQLEGVVSGVMALKGCEWGRGGRKREKGCFPRQGCKCLHGETGDGGIRAPEGLQLVA